MNLKVIAYVMARLQFAVSLALVLPLLAAIYWHESCAMDFAGAFMISMGCGTFFDNYGELQHEKLTLREGLAITCITWFMIATVCSLPFLAGHYLSLVDSIFEGFSGITCTGATVIPDMDVIPRSIIFWRGIIHWIGGLGIIVIFIALFPQAGSGANKMFDAETTGPSNDRVVPRLKQTAHVLLAMYFGFTMTLIALLLLCGLGLFDAVNMSFTAIATGGFATRNEGMAAFANLPAEICLIIFMLIGGGNFGLYFLAWKKGIRRLLRDTEFRVYLGLFFFLSTFICINLTAHMGMDSNTALRIATFQVAAVMTTTGLVIDNFDQWPAFSQFCIILVMLTGGCAGSTAGGMKLTRVIVLCKMVGNIVQARLHPQSVGRISMAHQSQSRTAVFRIARFFFLYILIALLAACVFSFDGLPVIDAILLGISCMGNAGVAFGEAYNFCYLPEMTKIVCCIIMVIGRLEIFTFLVMLQPGFWRQNSNW